MRFIQPSISREIKLSRDAQEDTPAVNLQVTLQQCRGTPSNALLACPSHACRRAIYIQQQDKTSPIDRVEAEILHSNAAL